MASIQSISSSLLSSNVAHSSSTSPTIAPQNSPSSNLADPFDFIYDVGPDGVGALAKIIADYVGEKKYLYALQKCSTIFARYAAFYDPEYRNLLMEKLKTADFNLQELWPMQQNQLLSARLEIAKIDLPGNDLFDDENETNAPQLTTQELHNHYETIFKQFPNASSLNISFMRRIYYKTSTSIEITFPKNLKKLQIETRESQTNKELFDLIKKADKITSLTFISSYNKLALPLPSSLKSVQFDTCLRIQMDYFQPMLESCPKLEEITLNRVTFVGGYSHLTYLPPQLKKLHISRDTSLSIASQIFPSSLEEMSLGATQIRSFDGSEATINPFPPNLKKLNCETLHFDNSTLSESLYTKLEELTTDFYTLVKLPMLPSLKKATIRIPIRDYPNYSHHPADLLQHIFNRAKKIEELKLDGINYTIVGPLHLPESLKNIEIEINAESQPFESIPQQLEEFTTSTAFRILPQFSSALRTLKLYNCTNLTDNEFSLILRKYPLLESVTYLRSQISIIPALPPLLKTLDLAGSLKLTNIQNISQAEQLETLILDRAPITSLCALPSILSVLSLQECRQLTNESLIPLENAHKLESLNLHRTNITDLLFTLPQSLKHVTLSSKFSKKLPSLRKQYPAISFDSFDDRVG